MALGFDAVRLQGCDKAHVLQHARMQIVREKPQGFGDLHDSRMNRRKRRSDRRLGDVLSLKQPVDVDGNSGDVLTRVVMQFAGDVFTLLFLRDQQTSRKMLGPVVTDAQRALSLRASDAVDDEANDEKRLTKEHRDREEDPPPIERPEGHVFEANDTARGQALFADAPA